MFELKPTTKYRRDVKRLKKRGYDLEILIEVQSILIDAGSLPETYKPHSLQGEYASCIDAHLAPDWILIYEILDEETVVLRRTGTHSDLFE